MRKIAVVDKHRTDRKLPAVQSLLHLAPDTSPDVYPLVLDAAGDRVYVVRLNEAVYSAASFLDERIAGDLAPGHWISMREIEDAATALTGSADFIFHIGHVGSTLLSRLLGLSDRAFSIREPAILRTLAQLEQRLNASAFPRAGEVFDKWLDVFLGLWARVYRSPQRSLIKATSFVGEMASLLVGRSRSSRAVLMYVAPQVYIASILGGQASRAELPLAAHDRRARLCRRTGELSLSIPAVSEGELAAMSWACELLGLAEAASRHGDRVLWLDFEDFLKHPAAGLTAVLTHLYGEANPGDLTAMLHSPDWNRYSKAPEHAYDAALRRRVLDQAVYQYHQEIQRGLNWLNNAARAHVEIAQATRMAAATPRLG